MSDFDFLDSDSGNESPQSEGLQMIDDAYLHPDTDVVLDLVEEEEEDSIKVIEGFTKIDSV